MNARNFRLLLMAVYFILCCRLSSAQARQVSISDLRIPHPSGSGEMFHGGVYTGSAATWSDIMGESHIRRLSQAGLNHFYISPGGSVSADDIVSWCRKNGRYVSFQHNYLTGNETPKQLQAQAQAAATFIAAVWDRPEYLTSSVKEEPAKSDIPTLFSQYNQINQNLSAHGGLAPLYLLHNNTPAANAVSQQSFKPLMQGYDRTYLFIWAPGTVVLPPPNDYKGYLFSPKQALSLINQYLNEFPPYVDPSIQWPAAVFCGRAAQKAYTKSYLLTTYGQDNYDHYLRLAQYNGGEGNQSFKESGDNILVAASYTPPPNCMSCQTWLAVAKGYRAVFFWSCDPTLGVNVTLMGPDRKGSPALDEYTQTIRELQKYGWLINRMQYQSSSAYISYTGSPTYTTFSGSHTIPGYDGKIVVLVNGDVGTWCRSSALYFYESDVFRISETGTVNPNDYTPKTAVRTISVTNTVSGAPDMYDLETGTKIGNETGTIDILPGKGKLVFIGSAAEMAELRAKCGMTTITAHTGLVPDRETIPDNIQVVYPVDPLIKSDGYCISTKSISLNKRYRVHITAKSSDGAQLGVLPYYYDGTWHGVGLGLANSTSALWNVSLDSTPTTFVSKDFAMTTGTEASVYVFRLNNVGTIQIDDFWIEDCSSHRQVDTEWMDSSITHPVNNGETYQVYVRARNYPIGSTQAKLGVKLLEYDDSDILLGEYYTTPEINGKNLSEQPTVFKGAFQKHHDNARKVRVKFINTSGSGMMVVESACVAKTN